MAQTLVNATMMQRFMLVDNVDQVYWTLAIELQFYLLMGLYRGCAAWKNISPRDHDRYFLLDNLRAAHLLYIPPGGVPDGCPLKCWCGA